MSNLILREASASKLASTGNGRYKITVIKAGQGSSGYYPAPILERDGPSVFPAGTKIYADHPTEQEMWDQPERSVKNVIGKTETAAVWNAAENALECEVYFGAAYQNIIEDFGDVLGMSIRAMGTSELQEVGGVMVDAVTAMVPTRGTSIDLVTEAGAGGKIQQRIESARAHAATNPPVPVGSLKEGNKMTELSKEDFVQGNKDLATAIVAGISSVLTEALKPKEVEPVNPVDLGFALAGALTESGLPPKALDLVKKLTEAGVKPADAIAQVKETLTESLTSSDMPRKDGQAKSPVSNAFTDFVGTLTESGREVAQGAAADNKAFSESWDTYIGNLASGDTKMHSAGAR